MGDHSVEIYEFTTTNVSPETRTRFHFHGFQLIGEGAVPLADRILSFIPGCFPQVSALENARIYGRASRRTRRRRFNAPGSDRRTHREVGTEENSSHNPIMKSLAKHLKVSTTMYKVDVLHSDWKQRDSSRAHSCRRTPSQTQTNERARNVRAGTLTENECGIECECRRRLPSRRSVGNTPIGASERASESTDQLTGKQAAR